MPGRAEADDRHGRRERADRVDRRLQREPVRLGHRHGPAARRVEAVHVDRDVDAVDPRSPRSAPTRRGRPCRPPSAEHAGAELRPPATAASIRDSVSSRTWPPSSAAFASSTDGPSDAATRSGSPRPQIIANGIPQTLPEGVVSGVLKSPWASNQAIARRAPGRPGAGRPSRRRAACSRHRGSGVGRRSLRRATRRDQVRSRGRNAPIAARFFARGSGSGRNPGSIGEVAGVARSRRRRAPVGRAAARRSAERPQPGRCELHARRGDHRARSGRRRWRSAPCMAVIVPPSWRRCASPTSRSSATSPAGSSRSTTCCAPRTSRACRWPSCSPWPTTRRAALWDGLTLGYTESTGHPLLRREIAGLYEAIEPDEVLDVRRRRGGDLLPRQRRCSARATTPSSPGPATRACTRSAAGDRRGRDAPRAARGRRLVARRAAAAGVARPDDPPRRRQRPAQPDRDAADGRGVGRADRRARGARASTSSPTRSIASSSSTRRDRLPAGADAFERGVSLGVMSKSFALAGLRIGWLATRDRDLLARCAAFKDYTTICSSAPSEILALIGLRARDRVLARSRGDRRREPRAARRVLRRLGRPVRLGPPARRLDRLPAAHGARRPHRRLGGAARRGDGVLLLPGSVVRPPGQPLPARLRADRPARGARRLEAYAARRCAERWHAGVGIDAR